MKTKISDLLWLLPARPGIYQMLWKSGKILYVGKSIHLKNRVSSYFNGTSKLNAAKSQMVRQVENIEWVETSSEIEALVLETNLIKKHRPKYNILMKDDKNLSYISIANGLVGEVFRTRKKPEVGTFFGPYTSKANIGLTLRHLRQIFKVRSCRMKFGTDDKTGNPIIISKSGKTPPCMDHYIGLCPAPCLLETSKIQEHQTNIEHMKKFLRWQMSEVITELREKMMMRAKNLEFEEAGKIKSQIESIEILKHRQIARDAVAHDCDIVMVLEKYSKIFIWRTEVRNWEIQGLYHTQASPAFEESLDEILEQYLAETYAERENSPILLLLEKPLAHDAMVEFLRQHAVRIEIPEHGVKSELIAFNKTNLVNFAYREEMENLTKRTLSRGTMENILTELGFESPKKWAISFECYDNSHTNGQFTVASRSVIVNGKSENTLYRKYKLQSLEQDKIDDFESMREIMERRAVEGFEQNNFPTMILIDGGKWQLSSALEGIERGIQKFLKNHPDSVESELRIKLPHISSIAKREEEIFVPGSTTSVRFDPGSPELMLVQKIRDEAHRFAITFNRASRSKAMKKNILEELPGFGPTTRKKLLKISWSVDGIAQLSREQLSASCTNPQIETLVSHGIWSDTE